MTNAFRITPNFTVGELAVSRSRPMLVEPVPDKLGVNVVRLTVYTLQPIRSWAKRAIIVNSGYRSKRLNDAVGGSPTSQHLRAEAVDWTCVRVVDVFEELLAGSVPLEAGHLGQVIYYPPDRGGFVHAALPSARYPVPTFFLATGKKTYTQLRDVEHFHSLLLGKAS